MVNLKSDSRPATTAEYDLAFILPAMRVALTSSFCLFMGPDCVELVPGRYATVPGRVRIANCDIAVGAGLVQDRVTQQRVRHRKKNDQPS
jgi:hypothetical protein